MWKKPSIEKPPFMKVSLEDMSEKESLDTNGGISETTVEELIKLWPRPFMGLVAPGFPFDKK